MSDWPEFLRDKIGPLPPGDVPEQVEIHAAGGVYVRQIFIPKKSTVLRQHVHPTDHLTMVARGSVYLSCDNALIKYAAPTAIVIEAGKSHSFVALEDETLLFCIHNLLEPETAAVLAEHGVDAMETI